MIVRIYFYSGYYIIGVLYLFFCHMLQALRNITVVLLRPFVNLGMETNVRVDEVFLLLLLATALSRQRISSSGVGLR